MKKYGFTLAEVLITLTIIGVVAALTLPNLNMSVQSSKVGPSLRKFINTMSNANEIILANYQSNTLRSVYDADANNVGRAQYMIDLAEQIRGTARVRIGQQSGNPTAVTMLSVNSGNHKAVPNDRQPSNYKGTSGSYTTFDAAPVFSFDSGESMAIRLRAAGEQQRNLDRGIPGIFADVLYDIDGFGQGANMLGIDLFVFRIDNRGSVIPAGGSVETGAGYTRVGAACTAENSNNTGENCAGHIADNNWKVDYAY